MIHKEAQYQACLNVHFIVWQRNWYVCGCSVRHFMLTVLKVESCPLVNCLEVWSSCAFSYLFSCRMPPLNTGRRGVLKFILLPIWWACCCMVTFCSCTGYFPDPAFRSDAVNPHIFQSKISYSDYHLSSYSIMADPVRSVLPVLNVKYVHCLANVL